MNVGDVAKRAGVVTGVAAGVAGALYAGERAVAARIRRGGPPEPADDLLVPEVDEDHAHPDPRRRRALRDRARHRHADRVRARRHPHVAGVGAPVPVDPAAGFRAVAFDGRGHGESTAGDTGHSIDNLAADLAHRARGARPARRDRRRPLDGRHGGAGPRRPPPRRRRRARRRDRAALDRGPLVRERRPSHPRRARPRRRRRSPTSARRPAPAQPRAPDRAARLRRRPRPALRRGHPPDARRVLARDACGRRAGRCSTLDFVDELPQPRRPDPGDRRLRRPRHAAPRLPGDRRSRARAPSSSSCRAPGTC